MITPRITTQISTLLCGLILTFTPVLGYAQTNSVAEKDSSVAIDKNSDKKERSRAGRFAPIPDQSLLNHQFKTPLPVSDQPFDYSSLDPNGYNLVGNRVTGVIKLDGRLDEADWQMAAVAKDFFQREPAEGAPASQPTEVRVLYDEKNLYVGFICYDEDPDLIMAPDMRRDTRMNFSNDMVTVVIAPLEGYREAYEFQTNPNGARTDVFVSREGNNSDQDWNGLWDASSQKYDFGWSAEFVIPFHALRFPNTPTQTWGINFGRRVQRSREESYWVPLALKDGDQALYRFGKGGQLIGLSNIKPGGRIQATPFSVMGGQASRVNASGPNSGEPLEVTDLKGELRGQGGGDLKIAVTSGITLNATINPDFAQVEADDQVVNLSRFEFQFTEKRPFFLERSDIFRLNQQGNRRGFRGGGNDRTPQLFFSRRVGRQLPDGQVVPVDLGMRVTGKIGRTTIGVLNVQTRETPYEDNGVQKVEPITNWQALRLSHDLGARSSFGMMATFKEPSPNLNDQIGTLIPRYASKNFNRVVGFDLNLASRKTNHRMQATYAKSFTDTVTTADQDWTLKISQRWQNKWLQYGLSFLDIGDDFYSQTGFVSENGLQRIGFETTANTFIRRFGIRRINGGIRTNYITKKSTDFGDADNWSFSPNMFLELESGVFLSTSFNRTFDTLNDTSRIVGVHFSPGSYTYDQGNFFIFTNQGKKLAGQGGVRFGRFYGGDLLSLSAEASFKPNPRMAFEPGISWTRLDRGNRIGLASDQFDYNSRIIPRFRMNYSFSPNLSFTSFVQLNSDKKIVQDNFHLNTVTVNLLLAYRSPFGHSFFLALNQFRDDDLDTDASYGSFNRTPIRLRDQQIVAKVSYLLNL
jgi:hypothetical protein